MEQFPKATMQREIFDENNEYDKRSFWKPAENSTVTGILSRYTVKSEDEKEADQEKIVITEEGGFSYVMPDHQNLVAKLGKLATGTLVSVTCDRISHSASGSNKFFHYRVMQLSE